MGTRADFYVGRGVNAEWLGSIGWDGYPAGIESPALFQAATEQEYREAVEKFFATRDDLTRPDDGWPWPWNDSRTTDYAYAFDTDRVWASCFGREWFNPNEPQPENDGDKTAEFPNMKDRQNITVGSKRSGIMVISG